MGKGGGGGFDTSALEEATNKSLALQERMYDEGIERAMPWYTTGVSSQQRLADLMGLRGGSMQTREQIAEQLTPQYTTSPTVTTDMYIDPSGRIVTNEGAFADYMNYARRARPDQAMYADANEVDAKNYLEKSLKGKGIPEYQQKEYEMFLAQQGYNPYKTSESTVDNAGLQAAIDEAYGAQQAPSDFGRLTEAFGLEKFQADPSYQFRLDEGNKAIERAMAARGKTFTPEAVKALTGYGSDLASTEYGNAYNRYNQDQNTLFGRLATLSGYGQNAGAQQTASGQNFANVSGQLNTNLANAQIAAAQAQASRPSMFGQLLGAAGSIGGALLSDERVKENIVPIGKEKGHNMYEFNYIGDNKRYIGVMAQEVEKTRPEAILERGGLKRVNYNMLGLSMREVK